MRIVKNFTLLSAIIFSSVLAPRGADAACPNLSVTYSSAQMTTLKQKFDLLSTSCSGQTAAWNAIDAIAVTKADSILGNYLKNYFAGCYHNNVPPVLTGPLAKEILDRSLHNDGDDSFERRLQRALAVAITDKLLREIDTNGGVLALGERLEGTSTSVPADCTKREEIVRTLEVLTEITEKGSRVTTTFRDEVYNRLKSLVDDEGAPLQMFGISPDPVEFPWLGVFQGTIWRAMRMAKKYPGGDALAASSTVRVQFADDIRAVFTYLQKHRDLIVDHGMLLADGGWFAQDDPYTMPQYGGTHELGYPQLQAKAIDRLLDLTPVSVARSIYFITEKSSLGNTCPYNDTDDKCIVTIGEPGEVLQASLLSDPTTAGTCQISALPCFDNGDCNAARAMYGTSRASYSRCPLLAKSCPFAPIIDNTPTVPDEDDNGRCVELGVNVSNFLVGKPADQVNFAGIFPVDTPAPSSISALRPNKYSQFCQYVQHEMNHAITNYLIKPNATLDDRRIELINQACDDPLQYLHTHKTFCGHNGGECFGTPANCNEDSSEFFASMMNRYMADTQTTLNLARTRWTATASKKEPINQFLYVAGIYSTGSGTSVTIPFYYQNRYTDGGTYYPVNVPEKQGVCQYQAVTATAIKDASGANGRIISLTTPAPQAQTHLFGYDGNSRNVATWDIQ
jgi:hypothetical protein